MGPPSGEPIPGETPIKGLAEVRPAQKGAQSMTQRNNDPLSELAHLLTGSINRNCCHRTGGYGAIVGFDPGRLCECRDLAETIIDNSAEVIKILSRANGELTGEK